MKKHLVLIGLPGSGKTTVGRLAAAELRAAFVDVDHALVRREGKPIDLIFAEKGEAAFREMERRETDVALASAPAVIAPGGGWAAQPGALQAARERALLIYLRTCAETAARRAAPEGTRPLLKGKDPVAAMRRLLEEREPFYRQAHSQVDADRHGAEQVAHDVVRLAQTSAGW